MVVQFGLAIGMIICTLVVLQQLEFIKTKDLGFSKDQLSQVEVLPSPLKKQISAKIAAQKRAVEAPLETGAFDRTGLAVESG